MAITDFRGDFGFLSNFYEAPLVLMGQDYPTSEHAYQAAKALNVEDREKIRLARTAGVAKRLGQKVERVSYWEDEKYDIMLNVLRAKFQQNVLLAAKLIDTEDSTLIEGNIWHDNDWGDCSCSQCQKIEGKNLLGKALMQVRKEIEEGIL